MHRLWTLLVVILVLAGGAYGIETYLKSRQFVETDNAYVDGNIVTVSAQTEGTIVWVGAEEGDYVEAGQVVVRLGEITPRNTLERSQHELALAVQDVVALKQRVLQYEAKVRQWQATYELAKDESKRRQELATRGMVSKEEQSAAALRVDEARSGLESARQALAETRINAGRMPVEDHPRVESAASKATRAFIDLRRATIVSPVAGHVAKRFVSAGLRIEPGRPLLQIVQLDKVWVEANFKETQLRNLRVGQAVEMISDLYGGEVVYHGVVDGTGTGTGSVFSLLPPQNATGNWLKIVQRVPVRITLDSDEIKRHTLPLGTSLRVKVDTIDHSGMRLRQKPRVADVSRTDVYGYQTEGANEMVRQIIDDHLSHPSSQQRRHAEHP